MQSGDLLDAGQVFICEVNVFEQSHPPRPGRKVVICVLPVIFSTCPGGSKKPTDSFNTACPGGRTHVLYPSPYNL